MPRSRKRKQSTKKSEEEIIDLTGDSDTERDDDSRQAKTTRVFDLTREDTEGAGSSMPPTQPDSRSKPSQLTVERDKIFWLVKRSSEASADPADSSKIGKWLLYPKRNDVDGKWEKVKVLIEDSLLWQAKVSTCKENDSIHVIVIYTKDYTDINDVIRTLDYIESHGLKTTPSTQIYYKTDNQTRGGIYSGATQQPWIYHSNNIRQQAVTSSRVPSNVLGPLAKLSVELVPKTCWLSSVRSNVTAAQWQKLSNETRTEANECCEVCESKQALHCQESWEYDGTHKIQRLTGLIALCTDCHEVKNLGLAEIRGGGSASIRHLKTINRWDDKTTEEYIQSSFSQWRERSRYSWQLDITYLTQQGITLKHETNDGQKVLVLTTAQACLNQGDMNKFRGLLSTQQNYFDEKDNALDSILHHAIRTIGLRAVRIVLEFPRGQALVNQPNRRKKTPFLLAVEMGQTDTALLLLQNGADATSLGWYRRNSLHHAARVGDATITKEILVRAPQLTKAEDSFKRRPCDYAVMSTTNGNQYLQMGVAPTYKVEKLVQQLIRRLDIADITVHIDNYHKTILHLAAGGASGKTIRLILSKGGQAIINNTDVNHKTALHDAAIACNMEGLEALLTAGADCSIRSATSGFSAFQETCLKLGNDRSKEIFCRYMQDAEMASQISTLVSSSNDEYIAPSTTAQLRR